MRKDKPCTGKKFGSKTCPPGSKRYNLAKTFREMAKDRKKAATRLFAMRLEEFDTRTESIMTIDESSDYDFGIIDKESQFEMVFSFEGVGC